MRAWQPILIVIGLASCAGPHEVVTSCSASGFLWTPARADSAPSAVALHPTLDIPEAGTPGFGLESFAPAIVALSDGRIVAGDRDANELLVFDSTGERVDTWGRRGSGPGEFRTLVGIGAAGGDSVWAFDARNRRLTVFDPRGHIVTAAALDFPEVGWAPGVLGRVRDGRFVVAEVVMPGGTRHQAGTVGTDSTRLHLFRLGAATTDPLGWFRVRDVYVSRGGMQDLTGGMPFGRVATFAVVDSGLFYGFPSSLGIGFFALDGTSRLVLADAQQGRAVRPDEVVRYRESALRSRSDFRPRLERVFEWLPFPARLPTFRSFAVNGRGRVWVQEFVPAWEQTAEWRVFALGGLLLGTLCAPASFRIATISESRLVGTYEDADGAVHAVVLPLPGPLRGS